MFTEVSSEDARRERVVAVLAAAGKKLDVKLLGFCSVIARISIT